MDGHLLRDKGSLIFDKKKILLNINGQNVTVKNPDQTMCLAEFLRNVVSLKGTKVMCRQGGCGACIVLVSNEDPRIKFKSTRTVNSCLIPIITLDGMFITTIEKLNSYADGLCKIQKNMITNFGMQCGYCTPGMIMSGMSGLLSYPQSMAKDPRNVFTGNICRCTGYRPIMDAMKCTAQDYVEKDIEDIFSLKIPKYNGAKIFDQELCNVRGMKWYQPDSLSELNAIRRTIDKGQADFINGNTGSGIYKEKPMDITVTLNKVLELKEIKVAENGSRISFGSSVTLSEMISALQKYKSMWPIVRHMYKIGHPALRNVATWAGNLMLLHAHHEFPSDIYLLFEITRATLCIVNNHGETLEIGLEKFLDMNMENMLLMSVEFDILPSEDCVRTFKVTPRHQNCYAYVNAAFRAKMDKETLILRERPVLVFGALGAKPVHATKTEEHLNLLKKNNISLESNTVLKECLEILEKEISPKHTATGPSQRYRKQVSINLFYKFFLALVEEGISPENRSIKNFPLQPYYAEQTYKAQEEKYPLTKPMARLDSDFMVSGKTEYTDDTPAIHEEAFAAFVLAGVAPARFLGINSEKAKEMPGFITVLTSTDIPGSSSVCMDKGDISFEEILCEKEIRFAGQPVAIVVADTQVHANNIAKAVQVIVEDKRSPVVELRDAINKEHFLPDRLAPIVVGNTEEELENCERIIEGELETKSMHHFYIEPQTCIVIPREKEIEILSATQHLTAVQQGAAEVLGIKSHKVFVTNKKCGGAFGGKTRPSVLVAAATAIAAHALKRPVRMVLDYNTDMKVSGARSPFIARYKVGCTKAGMLRAIKLDIFIDTGYTARDVDLFCIEQYIDNAYYCPNWQVTLRECKTDRVPGTHLRGPGSSQSKYIIESIIDNVAFVLSMPPEKVRKMNFYQDNQVFKPFQPKPLQPGMLQNTWNELIARSNFLKRNGDVKEFNKKNRWRKRGITLMPLLYRSGLLDFHYTASMSIFYTDGSVVVYHSGTEMGQGINTRVCQLAAKWLGVPVETVSVSSSSTRTAANSSQTGASVTSEQVGMAVTACCELLNERLKPIREEFPNISWRELIAQCEKRRIDLSVIKMFNDKQRISYSHSNFAAVCTEAEVDILTGETALLRTDIMFDSGQSINPAIDIGQLEGGFVMGIGQFLQEKIIDDPQTGEELTSILWHYFAPVAGDVPNDFRVYLADNTFNTENSFGSKAVGEPGVSMAVSCLLAAKSAVAAARRETGNHTHFTVDAPATIDSLQQLTEWSIDRLTIA